jgi:hypothetical protein
MAMAMFTFRVRIWVRFMGSVSPRFRIWLGLVLGLEIRFVLGVN